MKRVQYSLRTLVLAVAFAGCAVGLGLRWKPVVEHTLRDDFLDFPLYLQHAAISSDGSRVLTLRQPNIFDQNPGKQTNFIDVWRAGDGKRLQHFEAGFVSFADCSNDVMFSPSGHWLFLASHMGIVHDEFLWNIDSGKEFQPAGTLHAQSGPGWASSTGVTAQFRQISPDDRMIVYQIHGADGVATGLHIHDTREGKDITEFDVSTDGGMVRFSADGRRLAILARNGNLMLWNSESRKIEFNKRVLEKGASVLALSPDATHVAVSSWSPDATHLINIATGNVSEEIPGIIAHSYSEDILPANRNIPFSPDGTKLFVMHEKTAIIYDVESRKRERSFGPSDNWPRKVEFSSDGKSLVCNDGKTVSAWNIATGDGTTVSEADVRLARRSEVSSDGWTEIKSDSKQVTIRKRRRPDGYVGLMWLPEFWLSLACAGALVWSVTRGRSPSALNADP